jgi:hypothetical protein
MTRISMRPDQRGVALPMGLLGLLVLTSLVLALSVLSSTEPTIAGNQLRVAQARSVAESGLEQAAWALTHATTPGGIADPLPHLVPAPYDGSQPVRVTVNGVALGEFRVAVAAGAGPSERRVTSTGWAPSDAATGRARQRITATPPVSQSAGRADRARWPRGNGIGGHRRPP